MMAPRDDSRYTDHAEHLDRNAKTAMGWTKTHSWMFLAIVTISLAMIAFQNRYHYFAPQGPGKTYRVDKLYGTLQQLDGEKGWVTAEPPLEIATAQPVQPLSAAPSPNRDLGPMSGRTGSSPTRTEQPAFPPGSPDLPRATVPEPSARSVPAVPVTSSPLDPSSKTKQPAPVVTIEPSEDEKFRMFKDAFEDYGEEEFKLAANDLYPDWKKNVNPAGTWTEFLELYREFIQWWITSGSPAESGLKLWKNFLKAKAR
jgi:hypothetical protein